MPLYEYECQSCTKRFEIRQRVDEEPIKVCPTCGGPTRRVFHPVGIIFKGSGWYVTDSRKSDSSSTPAASSSDKTSETNASSTNKESASTPSTDKGSSSSSSGDGKSSDSKSGESKSSESKSTTPSNPSS